MQSVIISNLPALLKFVDVLKYVPNNVTLIYPFNVTKLNGSVNEARKGMAVVTNRDYVNNNNDILQSRALRRAGPSCSMQGPSIR